MLIKTTGFEKIGGYGETCGCLFLCLESEGETGDGEEVMAGGDGERHGCDGMVEAEGEGMEA